MSDTIFIIRGVTVLMNNKHGWRRKKQQIILNRNTCTQIISVQNWSKVKIQWDPTLMIFTIRTFTFAQNPQNHTSSLWSCFCCALFRSITDFILYVMLCDNQLRMFSLIQLTEKCHKGNERASEKDKSESACVVFIVHSFTIHFHMMSHSRTITSSLQATDRYW